MQCSVSIPAGLSLLRSNNFFRAVALIILLFVANQPLFIPIAADFFPAAFSSATLLSNYFLNIAYFRLYQLP